MGVDSGLPDYRGPEGFWRAYPPYRALGLRFEELADPVHFADDPELAWGFYGHRLALYRGTVPHVGFEVLLRWARERPTFVFTSNVDGQFQRAGFDPERVAEVHGSIHRLQCLADCGQPVWPADGVDVAVDPTTMRAAPPLPCCPPLRRPGPAEHPDVRRRRLGLLRRRPAAGSVHGVHPGQATRPGRRRDRRRQVRCPPCGGRPSSRRRRPGRSSGSTSASRRCAIPAVSASPRPPPRCCSPSTPACRSHDGPFEKQALMTGAGRVLLGRLHDLDLVTDLQELEPRLRVGLR